MVEGQMLKEITCNLWHDKNSSLKRCLPSSVNPISPHIIRVWCNLLTHTRHPLTSLYRWGRNNQAPHIILEQS